MEQYTISHAYIRNIEVSIYENGVFINSVIVVDRDISGYVSCLQSQGYVEVSNMQKILEESDTTRGAYTVAIGAWEKAKTSPSIRREG